MHHTIMKMVASVLLLGLTACQTVSPQSLAKNTVVTTPDELAWFVDEGDYQGSADKSMPFVFFLQGSGGGNTRAYLWAEWLEQYGIGSIVIDNAGVRNVSKLFKVSSLDMAGDVQATMDLIKSKSHFEISNYAVMGFSKGGTASLEVPSRLVDGTKQPDFIFALYPGLDGICPNHAGDQTSVHVFYGDLDEWGSYQGNRAACQSMAERDDNAAFHLMKGAHHGYDDKYGGSWSCCGRTFRSSTNAEARKETQDIILSALRQKWHIKKID